MKYFIKITQTYSCKNKLDHAIFKALSDIDCLALDTDDIHAYLRGLSAKIDGANEEHPRCTPRNLNIFSLHDQEGYGNIGCGVEGVLRFSVYVVKTHISTNDFR